MRATDNLNNRENVSFAPDGRPVLPSIDGVSKLFTADERGAQAFINRERGKRGFAVWFLQ